MRAKQPVDSGYVERDGVPSDSRYDEARALYNGMIDKRPAIIARCVDVADVIRSVKHGLEKRLPIAIADSGEGGHCLRLKAATDYGGRRTALR